MPRSLLNSHAPLIQELLGKGATNQEILKALSDKSVKTSLEAVRVWVNKNAKSDLLKGRGKGRRKNPEHVRFDFLPDYREGNFCFLLTFSQTESIRRIGGLPQPT